MSTTIPAGSSASGRKVASTTNVAPCRRWAGPKTAPVKLCATIMWSRTVTLNTHSPLLVADRVAQGGQPAVGQPGQHVGQLVEPRGPGEQRVERRVPQQLQCEREPVPGRPGGAARRCDHAHLAGPQREPAGVEGTAEGQDHLPVAVPAELEDGALGVQQVQGTLQPRAGGAGVDHEVAPAGGLVGGGEGPGGGGGVGPGGPRPPVAWSGAANRTPSRAATSARPASTSTSSTSIPGNRASSRATQQPTIPAPTTLTRSPTSGAASQRALTAVSTVPASTARRAGTSSGTGTTAPAGTTYAVWCG